MVTDSAEIAPMLYVKLRDLLAGAWLVVCYRFFRSSPAQSIFEYILIFENNFESNQKNLSREFRPDTAWIE